MHFKDPAYFLLFLLFPLLLIWFHRQKPSSMRIHSLRLFREIKPKRAEGIRNFLIFLRLLILAFIVLALARPQKLSAEREFNASGVDIMLALDISGSMLAEDFKPKNRIIVAKEEAKKFVLSRHSDRIGLVVFARKSYTQCPLTLDYHILDQLISDVEIGMIKDGTAIGLAIANAVNRLRNSTAKSKIIILLTDGDNNSGNIDPITAAELAKSFGIKVYTIGIGTGGMVPFPIDDPIFGKRYVRAKVDINEPMLKRIADLTGGLYFPARDAKMLSQVYTRINQLEKSEFKVKEYTSYAELFPYFLYPGLLLFMLDLAGRHLFFLKLP